MSQTKGVSYELAKELKDAVFPFRELEVKYHNTNEPRPDIEEMSRVGFIGDGISPFIVFEGNLTVYKSPTLSELIEACGEDFVLLTRWKEQGGKFTWQVRGERGVVSFVYLGQTPEVAVARLYIAIHSSQNLDKPGIITVNQ